MNFFRRIFRRRPKHDAQSASNHAPSPEHRSREETPLLCEKKQCAVCGLEVEEGLIVCPQCGQGVFNTPKTKHVPSLDVSDNTSAYPQGEEVCRHIYSEYHNLFLKELARYTIDNPGAENAKISEHAVNTASGYIMAKYNISSKDMVALIGEGYARKWH